MRSLWMAALALLLATPLAAAELEVHLLNLEQPTLPPVLSQSLSLSPGGGLSSPSSYSRSSISYLLSPKR